MRYVKKLTINDITVLTNNLRDSTDFRERQRSQIILMSHQKMNVKSVSIALSISRDTVERCLNRYESTDFVSLKDLPRSGRPSVLTASEKKL